MPIEQKDGFFEFTEFGMTPSLGLESAQLSRCIAEVKRRQWLGVFGNPGFGFQESDLDFLKQLPELIQIWLWDVKLKDIEGLYALRGLRYFGIQPDRPGIDFSRFPALETLVWTHNKHDRSVESLTALRELHVWYFNPRAKSFDELAIPQFVEQLGINWANEAHVADTRVLLDGAVDAAGDLGQLQHQLARPGLVATFEAAHQEGDGVHYHLPPDIPGGHILENLRVGLLLSARRHAVGEEVDGVHLGVGEGLLQSSVDVGATSLLKRAHALHRDLLNVSRIAGGDGSGWSSRRWTWAPSSGGSSHTLVEAMGGSIRVESTPGQGATFRVVLPIRPPDVASSPHPMLP
ncbi:hypothetical protein F0U59_50675 [Archangium gephyra]|nr:hypothetical protein F0U59_50675 [Archangium gephyra]